jgi:hypothetical protein
MDFGSRSCSFLIWFTLTFLLFAVAIATLLTSPEDEGVQQALFSRNHDDNNAARNFLCCERSRLVVDFRGDARIW